MRILNPLTWAKANVAALVGAVAGGLVFWFFNLLKFNLVFGLSFAIAYAVARFAEVAYHAMSGSSDVPTTNSYRR